MAKTPTPQNTIAIGIAAAMGGLAYTQAASNEASIGMRIATGALAFVVTAAVAIGVLTLLRRFRKARLAPPPSDERDGD